MQTGNFLEKLWTRPPDPEHLRLLLPWLLPDASLEVLPGKAFKNLNQQKPEGQEERNQVPLSAGEETVCREISKDSTGNT